MARAGAVFLCLLALSGAALAQSADFVAPADFARDDDVRPPTLTVNFAGAPVNGQLSGFLTITNQERRVYTALATTVAVNNANPMPINCALPASSDDDKPVICPFAVPVQAPAPGFTYFLAASSTGVVSRKFDGKQLATVTVTGTGAFTVPAAGAGRKMLQAQAPAGPVLTVVLQKPAAGMVTGSVVITNANAAAAFLPLMGGTNVVLVGGAAPAAPIACGDGTTRVEAGGAPLVCTFSLAVPADGERISVASSSKGFLIDAQTGQATQTLITGFATIKY